MGVLFLMPNWSAPSELWLQRMIAALHPHIVAVGAWDAPDSPGETGFAVFPLRDDPTPALPSRGIHAAWRKVARRFGLPVARRPARTAAQRLEQVLELGPVSAVLVHYLEFALQFDSVWQRCRPPLFVHCHGYDTEWDLRRSDDPARPYFAPDYVARVRRLSERAVLIANSHCTAARLRSIGVPTERIVVKYIGVPVPPTPPTRTRDGSPLEVLYLGRLCDCKGPDLVITAFERACAQGLEARLTLAGDGELRQTCERLASQSRFHDRIRLTGAVDAATGTELRARAAVFTAHNRRGPLTQQEEAFGVSIVEAMAAGLPVVTGRSGGVCETVVDGETGVLVPPGDVDAHAAALLRLGRDAGLRQRLGHAGWRRARTLFSIEQERAALLRILGLIPPVRIGSPGPVAAAAPVSDRWPCGTGL